MKKEELASLVTEYGDAIITYRSENSRKLKYNVCTLDFTTPYVAEKKNRAKGVLRDSFALLLGYRFV